MPTPLSLIAKTPNVRSRLVTKKRQIRLVEETEAHVVIGLLLLLNLLLGLGGFRCSLSGSDRGGSSEGLGVGNSLLDLREEHEDDQSMVATRQGHGRMGLVIRGIGFSACVNENQLANVGIFSVIFLLIILSGEWSVQEGEGGGETRHQGNSPAWTPRT